MCAFARPHHYKPHECTASGLTRGNPHFSSMKAGLYHRHKHCSFFTTLESLLGQESLPILNHKLHKSRSGLAYVLWLDNGEHIHC